MLDKEDRALIVTAAVKAMIGAEPVREKNQPYEEYKRDLDVYFAEARTAVEEILDSSDPEYGLIGKTLQRLEEATKVFTVDEIVSVQLEETSQRIVITGRSDKIDPKTKELKVDMMRTNRVDDFMFGSAARALGNKAKRLIGQRAQIKIRMEKMASGTGESARVVESIRGLGKKRDD